MLQPPNPAWMPYLKMIFGFMLLIILGSLAAVIAIGKIEATTSYGLDLIIGGLLTLSGGFVGWAFREKQDGDHPAPPQDH
jgi:hypothetical protein